MRRSSTREIENRAEQLAAGQGRLILGRKLKTAGLFANIVLLGARLSAVDSDICAHHSGCPITQQRVAFSQET